MECVCCPQRNWTRWAKRTVKLKNGREAAVTLHILEGSKDEIEKQLRTSWTRSSTCIRRFEALYEHGLARLNRFRLSG